MRLFTAIALPPQILDSVQALLASLRPLANLRWSPRSHLHVTTKFIGDWPADRIPELSSALDSVNSSSFDMRLGGLGWFPNLRSPRVFWMGVDGGQGLRTLAEKTETILSELGCPKEQRAFSPHLTLARVRQDVDLRPLRGLLESQAEPAFPAFPVSEFELYRSEAGVYSKLQSFRLVLSSE